MKYIVDGNLIYESQVGGYFDVANDIATLIIAIFVPLLTYILYKRTRKADQRCLIVFRNVDFDPNEESTWVIENVGKGVALDVLVGTADSEKRYDAGKWTEYPALPVGKVYRLNLTGYELAAYYNDITGQSYRTVCCGHRNKIDENVPRPAVRPSHSHWSLSMEAGKKTKSET
ncbi:hypothetical protein V6C03_13190 [Methyloligella sp. 2.7D]|uniref:hypothetical protein n=1 Tax=unclassified Methyloligella TaxID=2625955 RepID=UPI00157CC6AE|nr:hypothetical protein [Methyloligella sp. GL2]QKP77270.1 hypothetical protein HT051_07275 [Methyloligella sp. GL2]